MKIGLQTHEKFGNRVGMSGNLVGVSGNRGGAVRLVRRVRLVRQRSLGSVAGGGVHGSGRQSALHVCGLLGDDPAQRCRM